MGQDNKNGMILVIVGALLIVVALAADAIGVGQVAGFGYKQILLLVVGAGALFAGLKSCKCAKS